MCTEIHSPEGQLLTEGRGSHSSRPLDQPQSSFLGRRQDIVCPTSPGPVLNGTECPLVALLVAKSHSLEQEIPPHLRSWLRRG